jgi:hypothetical protein
MKKNATILVTAIALLAALSMLVRLVAQEPQNESTTQATANPIPFANQPLVPDAIRPAGAGFTLTINGTGFVPGSIVKWNGSARATTFVSASRLTAIIVAADIVKPTTSRVTVVNPAPGGGTSNAVFFEVTLPTASVEMTTSFVNGVGSNPSALAAGDFNADGKLDLVVANLYGGDVSVFLGEGNGTFEPSVNYSVGSDPYSVAVGDFNGDGKLDLAVVNDGSNTVSILLAKGDGTFQAAVHYGTGPQPTSVAVADFNGDGKLDLAVSNFASNSISVLLGNGNGTFRTALNYDAGTQPWSVAVGDFDRDGKLDVAVANKSSDNVSILLGNGDGTFRSPVNYAVGSAPESLAVGDFNHDSKLDLAVGNFDSYNISVLLGNGDGTFQAAVNYAVAAPQSLAVADLNGDDIPDLIAGSFGSNAVSVLLGSGNGTFRPAANFGCVTGAVTVGDFNSDGRLDVAGVPACGGTLGVLLQAPIVALSKPSLNFGTQLTGTSSHAQAVTLTNTGALAVSVNSIATSGQVAEFAQTHTCGSTLAPSASCSISVIFAPTSIGPHSASLMITDDAVGSPQSIALSGVGVVPGANATLGRSTLNFSVQPLGVVSTQSVSLGNYGTLSLAISGIGITGADVGDFDQTNTCGTSLPSGTTCKINVAFKPSQIGPLIAKLSVSDNASGTPQTASLSGTGTAVELSPTSLKFACFTFCLPVLGCHCDCFTSKTTTLTNVARTPLDIEGVAIEGPFSQTNTCGTSVGAGNSCSINVTWSRISGRGGISVSDNGGASPQTVSLTGEKQCSPP